jgi:predicted nucleic acid-binding protein
MTVFVETDFLLTLAKDDDWLQARAEETLEARDVVTSPFAYLELLIVLERYQFDYVRLFANLLDVIPVGDDRERQIVLKTVNYVEDGMTPFDAVHAATAETRGPVILSSDGAYGAVDPERTPLEPRSEETGNNG